MTKIREICTWAFGELQYFAEGETPSAGAMADAVRSLNRLVSSWHTMGMLIFWPTGKNWRSTWAVNTTYAVDDAVSRSGSIYVCTAVHTSSLADKPGVSANWASYWSIYRETAVAIDDDFPLPPEFEMGVTAMLAVQLGKIMGVTPGDQTRIDARAGETALYAAYLPINPVTVDNGLIRMPSQIWPYNIDQVS